MANTEPLDNVEVIGRKKAGTFNVSSFRSKIDSLGGIARTTLFRVEIIVPPFLRPAAGKINTETLSFLVASVNFPGLRLTTHPSQRYGIGPQEEIPTGIVFGSCDMNILGDAEGNVLKFFRNWSRGIVEYQSAKGNVQPNKTTPFMKPFHVEYKKKIETQLTISLYDPTGNQTYKLSMTKAFPVDISSMYLAWSNTDQVMYIPVRFSFFDMAFDGDGDFLEGEKAQRQTLSVMERIYSGGAAAQSLVNYFDPVNNVAEVINAINNTVAGIRGLGTVFSI